MGEINCVICIGFRYGFAKWPDGRKCHVPCVPDTDSKCSPRTSSPCVRVHYNQRHITTGVHGRSPEYHGKLHHRWCRRETVRPLTNLPRSLWSDTFLHLTRKRSSFPCGTPLLSSARLAMWYASVDCLLHARNSIQA